MSALGYILLFYIGFYFYRLAENHNKNKWLYGLLGVVLFFISLFVSVLLERFFRGDEINEFDIAIISVKSIFIGTLVVFIVFQILDSLWERKKNNS